MAGKVLTATVKLNTTSAERSIKKLDKLLNSVNRTLNRTKAGNLNNGLINANKLANKLSSNLNRVNSSQGKVVTGIGQMNLGFQKGNDLLGSMGTKLKALASTYLGIMGMKAVTKLTDTMIGSENKLNYVNSQQLGASAYNDDDSYSTAVFEATDQAMNKMYTSSQKVRMSYTDMMSNVSKSMALAGGAFQNNTDNAIRFQEIMAEAYTIGGASAGEMHSSMYQMMQALGAGTLAGDELRSVREGAPLAYQAIEQYAQGVFNSTESLKEMASQGKITSDMVVAAIMDAGTKMDSAFNQTKITFAQVWTQIKNTAFKAFEPIADKLSEMLTKITENGLVEKLEGLFNGVANALLFVFNILISVADWIINNWYWLQYIVYAVLICVAIYLGIMAAEAIVTGLTMFWAFITALSPIYLIILAIGLVIAALVWLTGSFEDACGLIVGVVMTAVAFVWNTIVGVINAIIQFLWTALVEPWIGIIEWVLNVFNGGFDSFGDAVKNLLGNIISWFLSLGKVVTKIIDAIFGTNWTDGLNSLQDKVLSWGKNEKAITLSREAPSLSNIGIDRWAYGDAYDAGYGWGSSFGTAVTDGISGLTDSLSIGNDKYDINHNFDDSNVLNGIKGDTGDIKDSMDLTNEDLAYLRKIAEMEWRNEFTTAEIRVEMTNNNTVNSERDLDGIMEYLSESLREEMSNVAYGVHY